MVEFRNTTYYLLLYETYSVVSESRSFFERVYFHDSFSETLKAFSKLRYTYFYIEKTKFTLFIMSLKKTNLISIAQISSVNSRTSAGLKFKFAVADTLITNEDSASRYGMGSNYAAVHTRKHKSLQIAKHYYLNISVFASEITYCTNCCFVLSQLYR